MDIHQNARLTPRGREVLVRRILEEQWSWKAAAAAFQVSLRTVRKWVRRYQQEGSGGLLDRSCRPHHSPKRIRPSVAAQIELLRRERLTCQQIAQRVGVSKATVQRVLARRGLNRWSALAPAEPIQRYEHAAPGDLLHLDIKKLGRIHQVGHRITGTRRGRLTGAGWEFVHVAIDDHSRLAFSRIFPNQQNPSAIAFLQAALAYYASLGIRIRRILTDNGSCYRSKAFRQACSQLGLRHRFTQPYRPCTNGKAERFIQTALREWAYAHVYSTSADRADHLPRWLHNYNWHRPHGSLNHSPPISRIGFEGNNLLRLHT